MAERPLGPLGRCCLGPIGHPVISGVYLPTRPSYRLLKVDAKCLAITQFAINRLSVIDSVIEAI